MPVVLAKNDYDKWLSPDSDPDKLHYMMKPCPVDELVHVPVDAFVNKTANHGGKCIEPIGSVGYGLLGLLVWNRF